MVAGEALLPLCWTYGGEEGWMDGWTACNQKTELTALSRTWCILFLLLGTLKAKDFKNRCMQMTLTQNDVRGKEDCLYLNIWIPQGKKQGMCLAETWGGDSQLLSADKRFWSISQQLCSYGGQLQKQWEG